MQVAISFSSILREGQKVLSLVPLFHVNAWGLPYTCALVGASPVFAGPHLDGESLFDLMDTEKVNSVWGVPTVLTSLLQEIERRATFRTVLIRFWWAVLRSPSLLLRLMKSWAYWSITRGA